MILFLSYAGASAIVATAIVVAIGARRASERLSNEQEAWLHRERLAQLAFKLSKDEDAPCLVRGAVTRLADRAFDRAFFREIQTMPMPLGETAILTAHIKKEFGHHYAGIVMEAISAMAFIIILNDGRLGARVRAHKINPQQLHDDRVNKIRPIETKLAEQVDLLDPSEPELIGAAAFG